MNDIDQQNPDLSEVSDQVSHIKIQFEPVAIPHLN